MGLRFRLEHLGFRMGDTMADHSPSSIRSLPKADPVRTRESEPGLAQSKPGSSGSAVIRWAPVGLVALALLLGYAFGLHRYLSLDALRESQSTLSAQVAQNAILAAAVYILVYTAAVALSFPGASFLTAAGGFMFGPVLGTALALVSATTGAVLIFLVATTSLGSVLARKAGPGMQRLREGFAKEGFSYLLFLRLVPVFPFWVVNLAAALFGMRLIPYVLATAIGIVPGTFVLAYFGHGLGTAIDGEGPPWSAGLFVSLALLGVLALVPVLVRKLRGGRMHDAGHARAEHE
jgi:uncharacterized membrane protein YdjX (TVP38/TMEM64 family)